MRSLRNLLAATVGISSLLFLAGCGNNSDSATRAGSSGEQKGILQRISGSVSRTVTIPEGTAIHVRLIDSVGSARSHSGETFHASLDEPITVNGSVVAPRGANVTGRVLRATPSGHLKTPAELAIALTSLQVGGKTYEIATSAQSWRERSHKKRNAEFIGGGAGAGALIGALVGHGKGAAIGAGVGAGAGTATAYATGKKDVLMPSETPLRFVLRQSVTVAKAG